MQTIHINEVKISWWEHLKNSIMRELRCSNRTHTPLNH